MMPFYGRVDHFRLAVESVLAQDNPDWRLTIVDDVFPDPEPGRWVNALADARITYLRNESNLGVSGNFQRCVELMTADYGMLMGCDDMMAPGFVSAIARLTDAFPEAAIIQPGVTVIDSAGQQSRPLPDRVKTFYRLPGSGSRAYSGENLAKSLLRGNWAYFPSLVWRSSWLQQIGFRADLTVVLDLAMLLEIVKRGGTLVLDDEPVFHYRRHSASVSAVTGTDGSKFIEERTLFTETAKDLRQIGWHRAARVADHHVSSRLNALTELLALLAKGPSLGRRVLLSHVLNRPYPRR